MPTGTLAEAQDRLLNPVIGEQSEPEDDGPTEEEELPQAAEAAEEVVEPEEEPQAEPTFSVTVAGEEREVSLEELRSGYMMQSDYSKKTQELAEQRKADEQARAELQEKLEQAELIARIEMEDLESAAALELKEEDPRAYYERKERNDARQARIDEYRQEQQSRENQERQARIVQEQTMLLPAIPEWVDQGKMNEEVSLMQQTWLDAGFTAEDMQDFIDHRWMVISRKAALYDRIANAQPEDKKVTETPKSAEPSAATVKEDGPSQASKERRAKLRKTGRQEDAQRAILDIIRK